MCFCQTGNRNCTRVLFYILSSGVETTYTSGAPEFIPSLSWVRVIRYLVLCVVICPFPFGHCVVCSSSVYRFWLPPFGIFKLFLSILLFCICGCLWVPLDILNLNSSSFTNTWVQIRFLVSYVLLIFLAFCVLLLFYSSSFCVLCVQCCQFLWIVHYWLSFEWVSEWVSEWVLLNIKRTIVSYIMARTSCIAMK